MCAKILLLVCSTYFARERDTCTDCLIYELDVTSRESGVLRCQKSQFRVVIGGPERG